ncbi:MAG: serine/threonine-protein kinase [Pseudomonadota bacterium]
MTTLPERLHRLRTEAQALLVHPDTRRRWLADAGLPTGLLLAAGVLAGILVMPALIDVLADWLTPDLREKRLFGLTTVRRASPLQPWVAGLLWLLYAGAVLYAAGRVAWQRRPRTGSDAPTLVIGDTRANPGAVSPAGPRYRIERELGRGAMGVVYCAEDTLLKRSVALKELTPQVAQDPSLRARFFREAQAVARLNHRGIVQIYDLLDSPDGCRIAMEFVRGPSLAELAGRQPQSIANALDWGRQIAEALACAHAQNVIHRDLKPANVLMAETTLPKLTDFGLARFLDSASSETQIGTVMGSPAYMSPEQAAGLSVDERSDIYAFGILLYELLDGRPPFTGESTQVMAAQITRVPDDIRARRPDVPEALATLVMKLLEKAPDDRPASMQDVATTLAAIRLP